jgi:hypothetical protein
MFLIEKVAQIYIMFLFIAFTPIRQNNTILRRIKYGTTKHRTEILFSSLQKEQEWRKQVFDIKFLTKGAI